MRQTLQVDQRTAHPRSNRIRRLVCLIFLGLSAQAFAEPVPPEVFSPVTYGEIEEALATAIWEEQPLGSNGRRRVVDHETFAFAVEPGFFATIAPNKTATIVSLTRPEWTLPARVVTRAPETDLCLIKVDVRAAGKTALPLDTRVKPPAGMSVFSARLNYLLEPAVYAGRDREYRAIPLPFTLFRLRTPEVVQIDYAGAAMISEEGQVLGIHTGTTLDSPDETHAIPAVVISKLMTDYRRANHFTPIRLGARFKRDATLPEIIEVIADTPAAEANLRTGDVILSAGGERVNDLPDLIDVMKAAPVNQAITLTVIRGTETLEIDVTPVARNP